VETKGIEVVGVVWYAVDVDAGPCMAWSEIDRSLGPWAGIWWTPA